MSSRYAARMSGEHGVPLPRAIDLVMFDLAGTTVDDRAGGSSLVVDAMVRAFDRAGIVIFPEAVREHRGKEKTVAIRSLLLSHTTLDAKPLARRASEIHRDFVMALEDGLGALEEIEGTTATFRFLKARGIRVGVGSGFPAAIVERVLDRMRWRAAGLIDYVGSAEAVGASRPDPKMILEAMRLLGVADASRVLKVGDTVMDVAEGRNAGARTAAVLTGPHVEEELKAAGADFVLPSVREVPELFSRP